MAGNRILILGIPGIKKSAAAKALVDRLAPLGHKYRAINFENEFLWQKVQQRARFLDSRLETQHGMWQAAWQRFCDQFDESEDCLLTMHGCFLDPLYGARCVFDPGEVARKFRPTLVITLMGDIYDAWSTTRASSKGLNIRGDPSLVQLLLARRMELLIGDQIALATPVPKQGNHVMANRNSIRNLMLSAYQPATTFLNAILNPMEATVVYLSFPISQPREMADRGDESGMLSVSQFVRAALELQHANRRLVVECPLMIDELPFRKAMRSQISEVETRERAEEALPLADRNPVVREFAFDRHSSRWPLDSLCPQADAPLCEPPSTLQAFPREQVRQALDLIDEDVTFRDYRLVDQADIVGVFNPILDATRSVQTNTDAEQGMAKSVAEEVYHAIRWQIEVFLYQNPALDPNQVVAKELRLHDSKRGQMAGESAKDYLVPCANQDELLNNLRTGGLH